MVSVTVIRPFRHNGVNVYDGQCIQMAAIDAAVRAREGLVSLLHGRTYQTRDMVAEAPVQPVSVESFGSGHTIRDEVASRAIERIMSEPEPDLGYIPPKRRRGRPRKQRD